MASTINAKNTSSGVVITSDTSGQLELQTVDTTRMTIDVNGNITLNNVIPSGSTAPTNGMFLPAANSVGFSTASTERMRIAATGEVGIGMTPDGTSILQLKAGNSAECPLEFTAGTLMTTVDSGSMEYDGANLYFTNDDVSVRGYVPAQQIFRLTANGSAIGSAIANFFGANSAINLAGGGVYEIEAYCYFTKTTAGTVTVTATTSLAPVNLNGIIQYGAGAGGTVSGGTNQIALYNSTSTASAFGATISLTTAVNHAMNIRLIVEANASASNLRINFTESAGTVTPLRGSYYKVTRLPSGNTGSFAA